MSGDCGMPQQSEVLDGFSGCDWTPLVWCRVVPTRRLKEVETSGVGLTMGSMGTHVSHFLHPPLTARFGKWEIVAFTLIFIWVVLGARCRPFFGCNVEWRRYQATSLIVQRICRTLQHGANTGCFEQVFGDEVAPQSGLGAWGEVRLVPDMESRCSVPWHPSHDMAIGNLEVSPGLCPPTLSFV